MPYHREKKLIQYYDYYDSFIREHFPDFRESFEIYEHCISEYANGLKGKIILCQGAGSESSAEKYFSHSKKVIAVDIDKQAIGNNKYASQKIVANIEKLPMIKSGSIDVVLSEWVIEHLREPQEAFKETARVLKKGGLYIFETPNTRNFIIKIIRLAKRISNKKTQKLSAKYLLDKKEEDIFPAYYRANSAEFLDENLQKAGLEKLYLGRTGCPGYFRAWPWLLWLELQLEKLLRIKIFKKYQAYIVGVYRKIK